MPDRLWTIEETAAFLCLPVDTLRAWRRNRNSRRGEQGPPAARMGKHLRYDPADVRAWINDRKVAA